MMVKFRFFKCNNFQFIKTLYTKSKANEKKTSDMGYMGFFEVFQRQKSIQIKELRLSFFI